MKNLENDDWKRVKQYRREMRTLILNKQAPAPKLISNNTKLMDLMHELDVKRLNLLNLGQQDPDFEIF
ncbi:hypothetical protein SC206_02105 [Rouxiella sp. T17]|uniref:hypothetical protein n=1 Tax=Rouxiella sp. T17 TaxID=3085684 RepID=UPI002FC75DDC